MLFWNKRDKTASGKFKFFKPASVDPGFKYSLTEEISILACFSCSCLVMSVDLVDFMESGPGMGNAFWYHFLVED